MNQQVIDKYIEAGKLAKSAMKLAKSLCKENVKIVDIADKTEDFILKHAKLAFPVQLSLNENAAHYCSPFNDSTTLKSGDLVKIDIGVHIDGYIADTASSISIGEDQENNRLIDTANAARDAGVSKVKIGAKVSEIGKAIYTEASKANLKPILNLTGHGLERYQIHTAPTIPNFDTSSSITIEEGEAICVEPFITSGAGAVVEGKESEIFELISEKGSIRMGRDILDFIKKEYSTCPFARRWLAKKFGLIKTNLALKAMLANKIIREYCVLREKTKAKVAQAEHTVLVLKEPIITTN